MKRDSGSDVQAADSKESSPARESLRSSDNAGALSGSTNNLEKAYEDLEREIMEIKRKLQTSVQPGASSAELELKKLTAS